MGHMDHRREANQPTRGWCTPHKGGGRIGFGKGVAPPFPFPLPLLPIPSGGERKGGRILLGLGVQVGLPPWRTLPGRRPLSPSSPNWTRRGAAPPFPSSLSFPSFPPPTPTRKRRSPTSGGSRTPSLARPPPGQPPPPLLLYMRGQGAPLDTTIDLLIS